MKKYSIIPLIAISLLYCANVFSQNMDESSKEGMAEPLTGDTTDNRNLEHEKRITTWNNDSNTILSIISNLREYRESSDDSTLQEKLKRKKLIEELYKVNKVYNNKPLNLTAVMIDDVTPEKILSEYGKRRARQIINTIKKDPSSAMFVGDGNLDNNPLLLFAVAMNLALCEKCYKETGRYEVKCKIPVPGDGNSMSGDDGYSDYKHGILDCDLSSENNINTIDTDIILILNSEEKALQISKGQIIPINGKIKSIMYKGGQFSESITIQIQ